MATELPKPCFSKCRTGLSPQRRRAGRIFLPNMASDAYLVEICIFVPEFFDSATALLISASVPAVIVYLVVFSHAYCLVT